MAYGSRVRRHGRSRRTAAVPGEKPRAQPLPQGPLREVVRSFSRRSWPARENKAGLAAVLSFFIPGVGQFYNGKFLRGLFWLIVTPGLWIGCGGTLGWICHIIAAYTAYSYAAKHAPEPRLTSASRCTSRVYAPSVLR